MSNQRLSGRFKSERIPWTDKELRITLGYYFFVYEYNTRKHNYELFTIHLRKMTGNNRAFGSVGVRFGNYNSVNPKKSGGFKGGDKKCKPIWDSCINADGTPKKNFIIEFMDFVQTFGCNNKIYDPFTKKYKQYMNFAAKAIDDDDAEEVVTTLDVDQGESFGAPEYKKEPKPKATDVVSKKYSRDAYRAKKAIFNSKYECNIDKCHVSFITKAGKNYMEAHHLIPIGAQDDFENSLDVDANIVCLCPNCHRKLHHGANIESDLLKLYNDRKGALKQSGIEISFDDLKKYYK